MVPSVAFRFVGLDVLLRAQDAELLRLPRSYDRFRIEAPAPERVGLLIELERSSERDPPPRAPDHPRFSRRREGDVLVVERADAIGRIRPAQSPVHAHFRVAVDEHALEACLRVALSVALPANGALILHSSAVRWHGRGYVFSGVSGAGKSTIAAMLPAADPGFERLADELLVVACDAGGWRVHVPPFFGIDDLPYGDSAPLDSINLLRQAPAHRRERLAAGPALRELMRHVVVYAAEPVTTDHALGLASRLVAEVPCYRLEFAKDPSVAEVLSSSHSGSDPRPS